MRRHLTSLALVGTVLLSACGTTVEGPDTSLTGAQGGPAAPVPGQVGGGSLGSPIDPAAPGGGPDGAAPGAGGGTGSDTGSDGGGATDPGALGGGTPPPDGSTPAPGETDPGGVTPSGPAGPGVTDETIPIGIPVESGGAAAADAFGISGASTVSQEAAFKAAINDVNSSGGVLGRKLEPAFHPFDVAQAISNPSQTIAEICEDYASDRRVLAVVFSAAQSGLRDCTAEMGSPLLLLNNIGSVIPAADYAQNGGNYLYGINSITVERQAELFIDSLIDRDFDAKWNTLSGGPGSQTTKIGVIHVETTENNALYAAYESELKKRGYEFVQEVTYPQNAASALAATQSAILRFKTAGITHVFGASAFFLTAAEAQGYRPRYAYLPGLGQLGVDNVPANQMRGAMTIGWAPMTDVTSAKDPGATPGAQRCQTAMRAAGLSTAKRADLSVMYNACDAVYSFAAALEAGGAPNVAGLRAGFEADNGFQPALTFRSSISASQHAGIISVRDMAYDSSCRCLTYSSRSDRS